MTQAQLRRSLARRTGESPRTLRRLGFQLAPLAPAGPDPLDLRLVVDCPSCRRPVAYPGRAGDGSPALAECADPGCDLLFDFDPARVYASGPEPTPRQLRPGYAQAGQARRTPCPALTSKLPPRNSRPSQETTMITIARCEARRLRAVLRRSALGIAHRGPLPPITFAIEGDQLRARHRYGHLAVEHSSRCRWPSEGSVALPLDALADIEGKSDAIVALDPVAPGRVVARWTERGLPQVREYAVPEADLASPVIEPPAAWSETSAELIAALAGASETAADDDARYALGCILLRPGPRGEGHQAVATDGRQFLVRGGFALPWAGEVLVRSSPIFACRGLPRDQPWSVG